MGLDGLDLLDSLQESKDQQQLLSRVSAHARELGFDYVCYGFQRPLTLNRPAVEILDAYPTGWMAHYMSRDYLSIDPVIQLGKTTQSPIQWTDDIFKTAPALWDEARQFGLATGLSQSCWSANGEFGLLSLARHADPISHSEFKHLTEHVCWLSAVTHHLMTRLLHPCPISGEPVILTRREKEVLQWSAEGKTASEIGLILSIAERTVNFHINNILPKLGATSKIQATVRAIRLGLI
ncbi:MULTISPECIES: autoinducer binding domain-containing protein [unclassified Caballeronia]|uniref:autoinducer binding domain-containing protein n=1 Tax=unclassified Caballeronia TaxID=2646786 RepID=UPI0020297737|nr:MULTISPECIES: autoinducer binding domain-containing protein [unclassified Caballeronia]